MSTIINEYISYRVTDNNEYDEYAKLNLLAVLNGLGIKTNIKWMHGELPRKWTPPGDVFYLEYYFNTQQLSYNHETYIRTDIDKSLGIKCIRELDHTQSESFIELIKNDLEQNLTCTTTEIDEDLSHWNCVCVCGADAYEDGFKYECKNKCGSLGPKDTRN